MSDYNLIKPFYEYFMKRKQLILWVLAIIFTTSLAYFQRKTGPTRPVKGEVKVDNTDIEFKLLRTETSGKDAEIKILTQNDNISGTLIYKRFKSNDEWTEKEMVYSGGYLSANIPTQPTAGKVVYKVILKSNEKSYALSQEPVIIRFKGDVPAIYLIPHIIFMFIGLLLSVLLGLQSIFTSKLSNVYIYITFITLVLGGLIFGPIVQKYAFGEYWTGFPFGHDFTDNKTAIAILFWGIALFISIYIRKVARWWVLVASIILLATYLVPHSVLGSEIDYTAIEKKN